MTEKERYIVNELANAYLYLREQVEGKRVPLTPLQERVQKVLAGPALP